MAGELQHEWIETGITMYAKIRNATGQQYSTVAGSYVNYVAADIANYDIPMTATGTGGRAYAADMPAGAASGAKDITYHKQAGGTPVVADLLIGTEDYAQRSNVVQIGGGAQSATDLKAFADDCYSPALNRVKTDMVYTNASVNDASATTTSFVTTITLLPTGALNDLQISFTSGTLIGQTKPIATYTNTTGVITVSEAFTSAPGDTDTFDIIRSHVHPVADIQSGLATATELAKVPKSDGTSTWNSTALASIQSEAADALNAYDPPTNAEMEARTLVAADYFDPTSDAVANVTTVGSVTTKTGYALTSGERDSIAAALLDLSNGVETGWTLRQAARIILSALAGKATSNGSTSWASRDMADTKDRISAVTTTDGSRTTVTRDAT
jgi:hypothetical protein